MPALTYTTPDFPFTPITTILSASVTGCFTDIRTLLNTTGLDDTNLANAGITRATKLKAGTANKVVINAADGTMSEEAQLATSRGGLGTDLTPQGAADVDKVVSVAASGTAFQLNVVPVPPSMKIFNFYNFA